MAEAKKTYTLGLSKIEVGAVNVDGGMGLTLAALGYTYQDTCKMVQEKPEVTEHFAEEVDDPVISISRGGKTTFNFSIMNPTVEVLKDLLGGTADTSTNKWEAPDTLPTVEKSVRITPKQGLKFEIPRLRITATINADFSKKGILLIECEGTVMQPEKPGTKKMTATLIA